MLNSESVKLSSVYSNEFMWCYSCYFASYWLTKLGSDTIHKLATEKVNLTLNQYKRLLCISQQNKMLKKGNEFEMNVISSTKSY